MKESENEFKKLGKNLEQLLKSELPNQIELLQKDSSRARSYVDIKLVSPNPYQPRVTFNKEKLEELANSIKEQGILTPILLRHADEGYEIVAGERRYRAALMIGLKEIPAVVEEFNNEQMMEIALIENIQREDLNVIEEAQAYINLQKSLKITQEELAKKLGKTRPYIANVLRLLTLPLEVQKEISEENISMSHARSLVGLDKEDMLELLKDIKKNKLNVRETEQRVNSIKNHEKNKYLKEEQQLKDYLQKKVSISSKSIKINFSNFSELEEIIAAIIKK
ncbi:MAG: ParB/RepB/Spo0J family partition protein [Erysipelotrichales bacterium]|nr:ParB/RepB/Spo0J family partition protein [Erysipelotrichales bacterium]